MKTKTKYQMTPAQKRKHHQACVAAWARRKAAEKNGNGTGLGVKSASGAASGGASVKVRLPSVAELDRVAERHQARVLAAKIEATPATVQQDRPPSIRFLRAMEACLAAKLMYETAVREFRAAALEDEQAP